MHEEFFHLLRLIGDDLLQPIGYIPSGLLSGCILIVVMKLIETLRFAASDGDFWQQPEKPLSSRAAVFLCAVYLTVVLKMAFFSREPGSRTGIDLALWSTWGTGMQAHAYVIENIIMFIPFGLLFPAALRPFRHILLCVCAAFVFSCGLELMQLYTSRGFCQLDDVVTNTLGALAGWLCWRLGSLLLRQKNRL